MSAIFGKALNDSLGTYKFKGINKNIDEITESVKSLQPSNSYRFIYTPKRTQTVKYIIKNDQGEMTYVPGNLKFEANVTYDIQVINGKMIGYTSNKVDENTYHPVFGAAVDAYVKESIAGITGSKMDLILRNGSGDSTLSQTDVFSDYDLLVYYANPSSTSDKIGGVIPIKLSVDEDASMVIQVADNSSYTTFTFSKNGFSTGQHGGGGSAGKMYAIYGVKF